MSVFVSPLPHILAMNTGKKVCFKYIVIIVIIIFTSTILRYFGRETAYCLSNLLQGKRTQVFVIIETMSLWQYLATLFNQEGHHLTKVVQK
jgi:hypothetical protein